MTETNNSNQTYRVKNPNWPEANQLAIYKRGRGFELGTTVNKSSKWSEQDLNSEPPNCKSSALTAQPRTIKEAHQTFDIGIWISIGRFKQQQQQQQLYFKLFVPKIHTQPASSKGYSRRVVLK